MLSFIDTFFFVASLSLIFSLARGFFQTQVLASLGVHMCLNCNTRLNVYEKCDDSRKKRESLLRIDRFVHSFCAMCASTPFFLFFSWMRLSVPESFSMLLKPKDFSLSHFFHPFFSLKSKKRVVHKHSVPYSSCVCERSAGATSFL